jgi:hypothetical protein
LGFISPTAFRASENQNSAALDKGTSHDFQHGVVSIHYCLYVTVHIP